MCWVTDGVVRLVNIFHCGKSGVVTGYDMTIAKRRFVVTKYRDGFYHQSVGFFSYLL